jgi:hypothetical protein
MIITVLLAKRFFITCVIASSETLSNALVGSSRISIFGFLRNILAIANLCLSHHESLIPLSPISVSSHFSSSRTRETICACSNANRSCSSDTELFSHTAYSKFSFIVPSKIDGSCERYHTLS